MRRSKGEQFYRKLSRKELQCLCKKYGLPARKSSSEMAKLLASYCENMSSKSTEDSFMFKRLIQGAPSNFRENGGTENNRFCSCSREEGKRGKFSHAVRSTGLDHCMGNKTYEKEASNSRFPSQCCWGNLNSKEQFTTNLCGNRSGLVRDGRVEDMCGNQNTNVNFCCPGESSLSSSSCEFYVHSEEGIKLCVDLSSSPSDWNKKLKSEVNICDNISNNKAPSFHEELVRLGESNKNKDSSLCYIDVNHIKDGNLQSESSPDTVTMENKHKLNHQDKDGCLTSIALKPSGTAVILSELVQEVQGGPSSQPNSDTHHGIHFCTDKNECVTTIEIAVSSPAIDLASFSGLDTSDNLIGLVSIENQKLTNEKPECSTQETSRNLEFSHLSIAEQKACCSREVPPSESNARCNGLPIPDKDGEFGDSIYTTSNTETGQCGLATLSEPDLDICEGLLPTPAEELRKRKLTGGGKGSDTFSYQ